MSQKPLRPSDITDEIPLFPLSNALLLPQTQRPFMIYEPRYISMINGILQTNRILGLIQPIQTKEESLYGKGVPLKKTGCVAYLRAFEEQDADNYMIVLEGICRFDLKEEIISDTPYRITKIDLTPYVQDFNFEEGVDKVNRDEFINSMRQYAKFADIEFDWEGIENIQTTLLINMCCVLAPYGAQEKQALLEAKSIFQRAQTLMALSEIEIATASLTSDGVTLQ